MLEFCRRRGLSPDPNGSAADIASLIAKAMGDRLPEVTRPLTALEEELWREEWRSENRDLGAERVALRKELESAEAEWRRELDNRGRELRDLTERSIAQAQAAFDRSKLELEKAALAQLKVLADERSALEAAIRDAKAVSEAADSRHEKRFKFLQVLLTVLFGSAGLITVWNSWQVTGEIERARLLTKNAETTRQQVQQAASQFQYTDAGLREYLFLSLSDHCRQIGERLASFRLSKEEVLDIRRSVDRLEPLLSSVAKTLGNDGRGTNREAELLVRLRGFRDNVMQTLAISNVSWTTGDPKSALALQGIMLVWDRWETSTNDWPEVYQRSIRSLAAYRENVLMAAKLHLWNQGNRDPSDLREATNHFQRAISLDASLARPYNAMGVAYARLMMNEAFRSSPDPSAVGRYFTTATNHYEEGYRRATEPRTRAVLLNNLATANYRWADFLQASGANREEARVAYRRCMAYLEQGKGMGVSDSSLRETEAEALGLEAVFQRERLSGQPADLEALVQRVIALLKALANGGVALEPANTYLTKTPLRHLAALAPEFERRLRYEVFGEEGPVAAGTITPGPAASPPAGGISGTASETRSGSGR